MFGNCVNSRKQGDIGLAAAISWFARKGYTVCVPLTDSQKYDLVVEHDKILERIQVKTTGSKKPNGNYEVHTKTCGGYKTKSFCHFNGDNSDYLFVLTEDDSKYLIPSNLVPKRSITLGDKWQQFRLK